MGRRSRKGISPDDRNSQRAERPAPRTQDSPAGPAASPWPAAVVCAAIVVAVVLVFGQTVGHDFVNFDDGLYVLENFQVAQGLSIGGIQWAFDP